jgi:uncharacterized protein (DUF1684 family)
VSDEHRALVEAFRARRDRRYASEEGWLTLVDRILLGPGDNPVPIGTLVNAGDAVRLRPASGVTRAGQPLIGEVPVAVEADGVTPDRFELAGRRYEVTSRGGLSVRVRDPEAPARKAFRGIPAFPFDPAWRIEAALEPVDPPRHDAVPRTDGSESDSRWVGVARFELGGAARSLRLYDEGAAWFTAFTDATNGDETYGAGRLLGVPRPEPGGPVILDFNLAYNLPCAFNSLVTCPLPSPHNRLPIAIRAGEKQP